MALGRSENAGLVGQSTKVLHELSPCLMSRFQKAEDARRCRTAQHYTPSRICSTTRRLEIDAPARPKVRQCLLFAADNVMLFTAGAHGHRDSRNVILWHAL